MGVGQFALAKKDRTQGHGGNLQWQKGPYIWAWEHFAMAKRALYIAMGTLGTGKKGPIYGDGDTVARVRYMYIDTREKVHKRQSQSPKWALMAHRCYWTYVGKSQVSPETPVWPHCPSCSQLQSRAPARQMDVRLLLCLVRMEEGIGQPAKPSQFLLNVYKGIVRKEYRYILVHF